MAEAVRAFRTMVGTRARTWTWLVCVLVAAGGFALAPPALAAPPETPITFFVATKTDTTAVLEGSPNPGNTEPGAYQFLYKATKTPSEAECESAGASKAPVPPAAFAALEPFEIVSQEVTGLTPNTEYVVCLLAENGKGETAVGKAVPFATFPEAPETGEATEMTGTAAKLEGVLRPPGAKLEYYFEYNQGPGCAGGEVTPVAEGEGAVEAVVEGLTPHASYKVCLVARGPGGDTVGEEKSFETLTSPPIITEEFATNVGAVAARLNAVVNPGALATSYRFDYEGGGRHASVPEPEGFAGSGNAGVPVEVLVEGLTLGTTYHYHLVATNELGKEVSGPDRAFTTQTGESTNLLDGRSWELVSPPDKHGSALEAIAREGSAIQASEGGGALAYIAKGPIDSEPAGNRSFAEQQLLATRGPQGWTTQDIATSHEAVAGLKSGELSEYRLFSSDLSSGLLEPTGATPLSPQAGERTPYIREANGGYTPLVNPGNVPPGTKFGGTETKGALTAQSGVEMVTASPDLTHVLLTAPQSLSPGFETEGLPALYEWAGGGLVPVSILPGGVSAGLEGARAEVGDNNHLVRSAVSAGGTRVVFHTAKSGSNPGLFDRDTLRAKTVQLDAPEAGAEGGPIVPRYQDASSTGDRIFFTDRGRLTVGATATESEPDLYMCELGGSVDERSCAEKGGLKDLTIGFAGQPADVRGAIIGANQEGTDVYFVANGVLTNGGSAVPGAVQGNCHAGSGTLPPAGQSCNLYLWQNGVTKLVTVLSNRDFPDWEAGEGNTDLGVLTARVSPNGRYLAFMSQRALTGYDNQDAASGARDAEVFTYDAASEQLVCASCDPSGARPTGVLEPDVDAEPTQLVDRPGSWTEQWVAASIPGWTPATEAVALHQSRYLSNEGRLFFNSPVGLVPKDANRTQDVYEFEPAGVGGSAGVGGCSSAVSSGRSVYVKEVAGAAVNGCVGLVSSGTSSGESAFLDASGRGPGGQEGEDVFFLTAAQLNGADVDNALDVYDAHVCSVSSPCPSTAATVPPACTTADSCRSAPSSQPAVFGAPASATFSGAGNLGPVPLAKPAVKPLTRAQKLAKALKTCRKKTNRKKRPACEKQARRKYGASKATKASNRRKASNKREARS